MRTQLLTLFFLLFGLHSPAQELAGPNRTLPGTLAIFEIVPAQKASWHIVVPGAGIDPYHIDSDLSKLYFASPTQGQYTVIAGITDEGRPKLLVKTFVNGDEEFGPTPTPTPPIPPVPPSSLETWIKTQAPVLVKSDNFVAESRIVADCFEQIVRRINEKNIQTPQNVQTQLQVALVAALALASPTAVTDWIPFLTELSRQLEKELGDKINDLEEMKKMLQTVADTMRSLEMPQSVSNRRTPLQGIDTRTPVTPARPFRYIFSN